MNKYSISNQWSNCNLQRASAGISHSSRMPLLPFAHLNRGLRTLLQSPDVIEIENRRVEMILANRDARDYRIPGRSRYGSL